MTGLQPAGHPFRVEPWHMGPWAVRQSAAAATAGLSVLAGSMTLPLVSAVLAPFLEGGRASTCSPLPACRVLPGLRHSGRACPGSTGRTGLDEAALGTSIVPRGPEE